jgi:nucleoside-diphosphate-sugar epimerase
VKVLVTGSSGRVGSAIVGVLAGQGVEVRGLDRSPGTQTTHVGDLTDARAVVDAARGVDAIVHTASLHVPDLNRASRADFASVNVDGTRNLLDAARRHGIRRLVYSSTTSLYGRAMEPSDRAVWVDEALDPRPRDIYDETKLEAESLCRLATEEGSVACVTLRFSRCFPEPEREMATYRLYRGVDVRDVAEAHRLALLWPNLAFEVFNISARSPFEAEDCRDLFRNAPAVIRLRAPEVVTQFETRGWPLPASIDRVYAIEKAERRLGYHPRYNYRECLAEART